MNIMMFAHGGSLNRGCEAIVRSTAKMVKDRWQGTKIYLASEQPESDQSIATLDGIYNGKAVALKKYSLDWFISSCQVKLFGDESYALGKINQNIIQTIQQMDVCLSIGGDNYCYGEQPNLYEVNRRIKRNDKKLVLWACSIGAEDLSERKLQDLQSFDLILARESITYDTLLEKGLTHVKLCADPAFTLEQEELALPEQWQVDETIGINFSPLVAARNPRAKQAMHSLIEHIINTTTMTIALTPHVMEANNDDSVLLSEFYETFKHTGRVFLLPNDLNAAQYKGYIARMRFFIGARTHATIAAYSNYVPTMVLGYSVKSKGIAKDIFGEEKLVLSIDELSDSDKLQAMFKQMVSDERHIKEQLQFAIPRMKSMSYRAIDYVKELA